MAPSCVHTSYVHTSGAHDTWACTQRQLRRAHSRRHWRSVASLVLAAREGHRRLTNLNLIALDQPMLVDTLAIDGRAIGAILVT